jgi:glucuronokinase
MSSRSNSTSQRPNVRTSAFARVGLLGNPSDAYGGKTIAFTVHELMAQTWIEDADEPLLPEPPARALLEATCRRFALHTSVESGPMALSIRSQIPFQVGLAGSSAIVISTLRALAARSSVHLEADELAELALAIEVEDLGIAAGPMDRVIQAYEGLLHMDFAGARSQDAYTRIDPDRLPPLLVAWDTRGGTSSGRVHSNVRERWLQGDPEVVEGMERFSRIVDDGMEALETLDRRRFCEAVRANLAARRRLFELSPRDLEMIELGSNERVSSKLCGSGGAVVCVFEREADRPAIQKRFEAAGFATLVPRISRSPNRDPNPEALPR